jgi:hypothetical protein
MRDPKWRKATFSEPGSCVELADLGGGVTGVRDSKLGDASAVLRFSRATVAAWLADTRAGAYDDLTLG